LTLLVGQQEEHPACKKTEWWDAGVVVSLGQVALPATQPTASKKTVLKMILHIVEVIITCQCTFIT